MKIINRYIIKEFAPQFILGLSVFTFILLMDKIFMLTGLIINKGVHVFTVFKLLIYTLPSFFSLAIPMAVLMGTLLAFGRMVEDNEITALRASGVAQIKIMFPIMLLTFVMSLSLIYFNQEIAPLSQQKFAKTYFEIVYQRPTLKLEENAFTEIDNYRMYVTNINRRKNTLNKLIIYKLDEQKDEYPVLITAKKGVLSQDGDILNLTLFSGNIQKKDDKDPSKFNQVNFANYTIKFDLTKNKEAMRDFSKSIMSLTGGGINKEIQRLSVNNVATLNLKIEYYKRITIAWACFGFALLACPLALLTHKHSKAIGFGMSIIVLFIYYAVLAFGLSLGERGILNPVLSLSLPNILLFIVSVFMVWKVQKQ
ncbi:MAG: LptF/LptG family permease [Elusimicrobiota bacterium]